MPQSHPLRANLLLPGFAQPASSVLLVAQSWREGCIEWEECEYGKNRRGVSWLAVVRPSYDLCRTTPLYAGGYCGVVFESADRGGTKFCASFSCSVLKISTA